MQVKEQNGSIWNLMCRDATQRVHTIWQNKINAVSFTEISYIFFFFAFQTNCNWSQMVYVCHSHTQALAHSTIPYNPNESFLNWMKLNIRKTMPWLKCLAIFPKKMRWSRARVHTHTNATAASSLLCDLYALNVVCISSHNWNGLWWTNGLFWDSRFIF